MDMMILVTIAHLLLLLAVAVLVADILTRMRKSDIKQVRFILGPAITLTWLILALLNKLPDSALTVGIFASIIFAVRK